jgi:hypothetical protein
MKNSVICLYAFCASLWLAPLFGAEPASCPGTVEVRQELASSVEGWTATLDDTPHRLAGITFYDGPLAERASLVSDRTVKNGSRETSTWRFASNAKRQIFIACAYSATAVVLSKPLPPKTATCSVTYNLQQQIDGLPVIQGIVCK